MTILRPLRRVTGHVNDTVMPRIAEHQPVELARLRLVHLRHEVPVAVERRLDRGVAELRLEVLRMRPLRDQEARVGVSQVVKPDALQLRSTRAHSRLLKLSGSISSPVGEVKTSSPLNRLGSRPSAALSVGARSMVRRERRDLGVTNCPRQSERRT